jgi:hypothetical protein
LNVPKAGSVVKRRDDRSKNDYIPWFNHHRLLEPVGYIPPAEAEANYYQQLAQKATVEV